MKPSDPLAEKRKAIANAILAMRQAKLNALQNDPSLDINVAEILDMPMTRAEITRDVARLSPTAVEQVHEHYCGTAGPSYVW